MNKHSKTAKGALCSLASVLSSGVLMVSSASAATIEYYSGTTANDGNGTKTLTKTLGSSSGRDNKYRAIYETGSTNGVLDSGSAEDAGVAAFEEIIGKGFVFSTWKASYKYYNSWRDNGTKAPGTDFTSTSYDLRAVAQWTDLKKAVFANGSTERMVVGTPFEVMDGEIKIGEISLDYKVNTTRDADGATKETPLAVSSIDEKITLNPDKANGYELKKVEVKIGEAEAEDVLADVEDGVLLLENVTADVNLDVEMGLKEFDVTATVTNEDGAVVSPIPAVEYGATATFDVFVNDGYKIAGILKDGEATDLEVIDNQLVIENVTADAEYTIVIEAEVYTVVEGDGQEVDVSTIDKALFRFDGPFELFDNTVTVDGKEFTDFEAYEGSTYIAIEKDALIALGEGEHVIEAFFKNGTSAEASFTISGIPTTPETGANSELSASIITSVVAFAATGSAIALIMLALKRKMNR